jgi:hypothetical protein
MINEGLATSHKRDVESPQKVLISQNKNKLAVNQQVMEDQHPHKPE